MSQSTHSGHASEKPATLIVTLGETPQVVTETVWALARRDPPFIPDRIWLATTDIGRTKLSPSLITETVASPPVVDRPYACTESEPSGKLAELLDLITTQGRMNRTRRSAIRVRLCAPLLSGSVVSDLRTSAESATFGDMVLELAREATTEESGPLHVSQAGGRKTMSFYAGQVITLLGRQGDELSHVLVEPAELEGCPDFWWPTEGDRLIEHRFMKENGKPILFNIRGVHAGGHARVDFHLVPFVRLGMRTVRAIRAGNLSFADATEMQDKAFRAAPLLLISKEREVRVGGRSLKNIPHKEFALLAAWSLWSKEGRRACYVKAASQGWEEVELPVGTISSAALYAPTRDGNAETILDLFLRCYADTRGREFDPNDPPLVLATNIERRLNPKTVERNIDDNRDSLASALSRLRRRLQESFPPDIVGLLGAGGDPQQDHMFSVALPPDDIIVVGFDETPSGGTKP